MKTGTFPCKPIDNRQLLIFHAVARTGDFAQAARWLGLRHKSAVSRGISRLECDLGVRLVTRHHDRNTLTEAGRMLLPCAEGIFRAMDDIRQRLAAWPNEVRASERLARQARQPGKPGEPLPKLPPGAPLRRFEVINSQQLLAFRTLAQSLSFTETGRELNLTQSAVTHEMNALERDLGIRLVSRLSLRRGGNTLTPAGEQLLRHAKVILREMELVWQDVATDVAVPVPADGDAKAER